MREVFENLMASAGVSDADRPTVLRALMALRTKHPNDTPARLFERARKAGAPIPTARCDHGVVRGQCVVCDVEIGTRFYFTGGGTHVHSTPTCEALAAGQEKVRRRGGNPEVIETVRHYELLSGRSPCRQCLRGQVNGASSDAVTSIRWSAEGGQQALAAAWSSKAVRLSAEAPPRRGQRIAWAGYSGPVQELTDDGVQISTGGLRLHIGWGELVEFEG